MDPGYLNQSVSAVVTAKESEAHIKNVLLSLNKSTYKSPGLKGNRVETTRDLDSNGSFEPEKKGKKAKPAPKRQEKNADPPFFKDSKRRGRPKKSATVTKLIERPSAPEESSPSDTNSPETLDPGYLNQSVSAVVTAKEERDIFQTPTVVTNKVSKLTSHRLASSSLPLLPTPRRSRSVAKQFLLNRDKPYTIAEDVGDTEEDMRRASQKKTPLKTTPVSKIATQDAISNARLRNAVIPKQVVLNQLSPSTYPPLKRESSEGTVVTRQSSDVASKTPTSIERPQSCSNLASQKRKLNERKLNDPENDLSEDDSGRIPSAKKRTSDVMLPSEDSMYNRTQFGSAIEPSTLPVPQMTRFNFFLASLDDPVRAVELHSGDGYRVSWLYLLPNVVFPLQTRNPITIMQLKGSVEFRNNPALRSRIILNSKMRLVELKAGLFLHIANTGKEVALIQLTEMFSCTSS